MPKRGTPLFEVILGHFGHYGGFPVKTVCTPGPPRESKPAETTVHHPSGVISEVLPRVNFALPACPGPKSTLWRTSEMTVYRFLCWLGFPGRPGLHTVLTGNPQKWPKITEGGEPFLPVFYLVPLCFCSWCRPRAQKGVIETPKPR